MPEKREEKWGSGGEQTNILPSILLSGVQPLDSKVDELRAWISVQRDIRD